MAKCIDSITQVQSAVPKLKKCFQTKMFADSQQFVCLIACRDYAPLMFFNYADIIRFLKPAV